MGEYVARWVGHVRRARGGRRRLAAAGVSVAMLLAPAVAAAASTPAVTTSLGGSSHVAGAASRLRLTLDAHTRLRRATVAVMVPAGWPVRHLGLAAGRCRHAGHLRRTEHGVRIARVSCPAGASLAVTFRTHLPTTAAVYPFTASVSYGPRGHRSRTATGLPFRVRPAAAARLVLSPAAATLTYGRTRAFHAYAVDRFGNRRGDVTDRTAFTMSPDGGCAADRCGRGAHADTSESVHRVTGTLGRLSGTSELLVTPRHVTVTAEPATKVYGQTDPGFTYQVAGLVVGDDSLDGVGCTVAGAHVGVGTYPLTCQGSTDPDYHVDQYYASTLTVTPAPLVVPVSGHQTYGGTPHYDADLSTSGLVNGDTPAVIGGALACHTSADATSNVGSYTISDCTGLSAANYTISYSYGALTVTPRPVAVTADDQTMVAGDADPAYTYSTSPSGTKLVGVTCAAGGDHTTPGSYPITCTTTTDPNYTETANNAGTLTVGPAAGACGNSVLDPGEACDDGNNTTETSCPYGDATCNACDATCSMPLQLAGGYCGDGYVDPAHGEVCDDGNNTTETSCPAGQATCNVCSADCSAVLNLTG